MTVKNSSKAKPRILSENSYKTASLIGEAKKPAGYNKEKNKLEVTELNQIFNTAADGMRVVDKEYNVLRVNETLCYMAGISKDIALAGKCFETFPGPVCNSEECPMERIIAGDDRVEFEIEKMRNDGGRIPCILTATPFRDNNGELIGIVENFKDVSKILQAEKTLEEAKQDLEKMNVTLEVLLKKKENDLENLKEQVLFNVKELIVPYIEKLKNSRLDKSQSIYIKFLESAINEIVSPFGKQLSSRFLNLTPTEIRIANLIKERKRTKEIALLLNVSESTIIFHRKNIREKLGLKQKKQNLISYLQSFE